MRREDDEHDGHRVEDPEDTICLKLDEEGHVSFGKRNGRREGDHERQQSGDER